MLQVQEIHLLGAVLLTQLQVLVLLLEVDMEILLREQEIL